MYLLIDSNQQLRISLINQQKVGEYHWYESKENETDLIDQLDFALKEQKIAIDDLQGIIVIQGKGTFSQTRAGIVFGNILAWTSNIAIDDIEEKYLNALREVIEKLPKTFQKPIFCKYSGKPNIT